MQAALLEDLEEYVIVRCLAIAENLMDPKFLYVRATARSLARSFIHSITR